MAAAADEELVVESKTKIAELAWITIMLVLQIRQFAEEPPVFITDLILIARGEKRLANHLGEALIRFERSPRPRVGEGIALPGPCGIRRIRALMQQRTAHVKAVCNDEIIDVGALDVG
ncbi:hypothetical protein N8E89_13610 [Phyllobacterium sp. A18/5-2]|nr:hypothetical protein [Phyllobacterium sp. A18/5-2]UXN63596.1 hypothetical protein N8E89_13610 [Phyllobacterium sp. A18/5-2]